MGSLLTRDFYRENRRLNSVCCKKILTGCLAILMNNASLAGVLFLVTHASPYQKIDSSRDVHMFIIHDIGRGRWYDGLAFWLLYSD